jgi:hypothetical protein
MANQQDLSDPGIKTNNFKGKFEPALLRFWNGATDDEQKDILADVLAYANANPQSFKADMRNFWFDEELAPLSVVLEALAKDVDNWSDFYLEVLDAIFNTAKVTAKPKHILFNLTEFAYVEKMEIPLVQKIADRMLKEMKAGGVEIKIIIIREIYAYLFNNYVRNKAAITEELHQSLDDSNWRVRYVTWQTLSLENILPPGRKLALKDKFLAMIFGTP